MQKVVSNRRGLPSTCAPLPASAGQSRAIFEVGGVHRLAAQSCLSCCPAVECTWQLAWRPLTSLQLSLFQTKWQKFLVRASQWRWARKREARRLVLEARRRAQARQLNQLFLLLRPHLQTQPKTHIHNSPSRRSENSLHCFNNPTQIIKIVINPNQIIIIALIVILLIVMMMMMTNAPIR